LLDLFNPQTQRTLVIGHRGAEALAPENTWAAFRAGYEAGADVLEVDVQLTRDGEAIIYHDFTLWPKLRDPRWVRDLAWEELRELDVGQWFNPAFSGERIPRLADLLEWARDRVALQVDLKHGFVHPDNDVHPGEGARGFALEITALSLIEAAGMARQVVISSWDRVALARIRAQRPGIPLSVNLRERVPDPVGQVAPSGARWVTVYWPQIDRQSVAQLKSAGLLVNLANLFTGEYAEALGLGVNAVTAADPGAARRALAEGARAQEQERSPWTQACCGGGRDGESSDE